VNAIAATYSAHPVQVSAWKKEVTERLPEVFSGKPDAVGFGLVFLDQR